MKPFLLLILLAMVFPGRAQKNESFYVFDSTWSPTSIDSAHFLLRVTKLQDTAWKYDYYNFIGPLIKSETYRDKSGTTLNGTVHYYDPNGSLDSMGVYNMGRKHGYFYKTKLVRDTLKYIYEYVYREDSLIESTDLSLKPDTAKKYSDERESEYPGGSSRWMYFLTKNLVYPERAINGNIQGKVAIGFMVDAQGEVHDLFITRSVEYTLDAESIRMILASGKWKPAFQNGKNVKSYKIQPMVFRLE